jgi:hypothetical protein
LSIAWQMRRNNPLGAVRDEQLGARIGQTPGCFGQHSQFPIQLPHRQQPRIADHRAAMFVNQASDPIVERILAPDMAIKISASLCK